MLFFHIGILKSCSKKQTGIFSSKIENFFEYVSHKTSLNKKNKKDKFSLLRTHFKLYRPLEHRLCA